MSYLEDSIDWQAVRDIDEWLDRGAGPEYQTQPLAQDWARLSKVIEELGEAIQAFIGYTGQNPRKGVTHTLSEVEDEVADVIITGILCLQHITKDTWTTQDIIRQKIAKIEKRVPR